MQDVAQVLDKPNCHVPDYLIKDSLKCACGDTAVRIVADKRSDSQYWCTGTLLLSERIDSSAKVCTVLRLPVTQFEICTCVY